MNGSPSETPVGIGVDWGSSRLRAYAFTASGAVAAVAESDSGVLVTDRSALAGVLNATVGTWRERWPGIPVIASGMVGSRNGLTEVPYVATPATLESVRAAVTPVEYGVGHAVWIIPGLYHEEGESVDVLRGEETPLVGWMHLMGTSRRGLVVLPGTHSKWVDVADGSIRSFCTFPTGELFGTLLRSASLAGLAPADKGSANSDAYRRGLDVGLRSGGLLHDYFSIRADAVTGRQEPADIRDRLSGLLIGYEVAEARCRGLLADQDSVTVIGDGALSERYRQALSAIGIATDTPEQNCLIHGWLALLRELSPRTGAVIDGMIDPV